jgi:quercetin dioxygenase-like cupin family protein
MMKNLCCLLSIGCAVLLPAAASPAAAQAGKPRGCVLVSERTGDAGCWIVAREALGRLAQSEVFWHIDSYPTRAAAEGAKGARGTVVEALGGIWLFTIGDAGWRSPGGVRVAEIGPLRVKPSESYTAQYMEGITPPGTTTPVHRHAGPEAWYVTAGELCLETPDGKRSARARETASVPEGSSMRLSAAGSEQGRWLVLVLHDTSQPWEILASDWTPTGLCKN